MEKGRNKILSEYRKAGRVPSMKAPSPYSWHGGEASLPCCFLTQRGDSVDRISPEFADAKSS